MGNEISGICGSCNKEKEHGNRIENNLSRVNINEK